MNPTSQRLPAGESRRIKVRLIRQAKNQCQGCGYQFPKSLNPHQLGRESGAFELDHKVPFKWSRNNSESNLQILCLPCHDGKSKDNLTDAEWRARGKPQDWTRKREIARRKNSRSRRSR